MVDLARKNKTVKDGDGKDVEDDSKSLGLGWCCAVDEVPELGWLKIQGRKWMERKVMRERR